ncbi:MAG TPA: SDR family oxidoreductase [Candidatus Aminicenantes bacterium]|nr:SDR family oxidoreductase [Candidatus Aminicenantes bacterium]HRY66043.1 SDR family oxidoreductase [Candidatus Aminicenantes bacterium]HRZ72908.1 SDR family oxidoreductase [Candidatus Aminicenantes bacterium]
MSLRIALVTGASRGIGRAIALRLAEDVSGVAVHYFSRREEAQELAAAIREKGKLAAVFRADLTKKAQAAGLVKKVEERFARVDVLVNNVGPFLIKPWDQLEVADWERVLRGNLLGPYFCMKAALPGMRKRKWGRVVNIGYSRAEHLGAFPTIAPYAVAKTGLLTLTRTAAAAEVVNGITVNMVSPGLIRGGALPSLKNVSEAQLGTVEDVAEAVAHCALDAAAAVTGANIIVAGTWKM